MALCWGIGAGKSWCSSIAVAYIVYRLGCMRDPAAALGLAPGSEVVIANVSVTEEHAKAVVFNEIGKRLEAPWFQEHFRPDPNVKSELRLPKNVLCYPGNSLSSKVLGRNVFMGIIDEAAFHGEVKRSARAYMTAETADSYSGAVELYYALQERAQSRFGQNWLLMVISSPLFVGDFINRKLKEYAEGAPGMYAMHAAQWDIKPPSFYSKESFWFDPVTRKIYLEVPEGYEGRVRWRPREDATQGT